jgi:MFS family permease
VILLSHFISVAAQFMLTSVLALSLKDLGYSARAIGVVIMIFQMTARCIGPIAGGWISTRRLVPAYVCAFSTGAVGFWGCAQALGTGWFYLTVFVLGFGLGLDTLCKTALLTECAFNSERAKKNLSLGYVVFNAGAAVGPLVAGLLLQNRAQLQTLFVVAGAAYLSVSVGLTVWLKTSSAVARPRARPQEKRLPLSAVFKDSEFRGFYLFLPLLWSVFFLMHAMVPVFLKTFANADIRTISNMFTLNAVMAIVGGHFLIRWLIKKFETRGMGPSQIAAAGLAVMGGGVALLSFAGQAGPGIAYVFMFVFTLGEIACLPLLQIGVQTFCDERNLPKAPYFAVATFMGGLGSAISNLSGSFLIEYSQKTPYLFPLVFAALAVLVSWYYWVNDLNGKAAPVLKAAASA